MKFPFPIGIYVLIFEMANYIHLRMALASHLRTIYFLILLLCLPFISIGKEDWLNIPVSDNIPGSQPVLFRENMGQIADVNGKPVPSVLFSVSSPGVDAYITSRGLTYVFFTVERDDFETKMKKKKEQLGQPQKPRKPKKVEMAWINMYLEGASIKKENITREGMSSIDLNFFYSHCPQGIYGVKEYEKITVKDVYPGIDWVLYGSSEKGMKYDFVVHAGADHSRIKMLYEGMSTISSDNEGNISISNKLGSVIDTAPVSFTSSGKKVGSKFISERIDELHTRVTYSIDKYSSSETLVIDPQLVWGTFVGGNNLDGIMGATHDSQGNLFVTGYTMSNNFPVQNAGTYSQTLIGFSNAMIMKFSNSGVMLWSTFYGGSQFETGYAIICDAAGNVFVTGSADSPDFPLQNAGTYFDGTVSNTDAFIIKFDNTGTRLWATYYGGSLFESGSDIDVDAAGNIVVAGSSDSPDLPVFSAGTFYQGTNAGGMQDGFILKFSNIGVQLWATYIGGANMDNGMGITIDPNDNIFIVGQSNSPNFPLLNAGTFFQGTLGSFDVFIMKFTNAGTLLWSTFYGGSNGTFPTAIKSDKNGAIYVAGNTSSANLPVQSGGGYFDGTLTGGTDAYILKFDNAGNRLWATYYGGNSDEFPDKDNIAPDDCGGVYMSLNTMSSNCTTVNPGCSGYFDGSFGGSMDCMVLHFTNTTVLHWATHIGAAQIDGRGSVEVDDNSNLFMVGEWVNYTNSTGLPVANPGGGAYFDNTPNGMDDSFVIKFKPDQMSYTASQSPSGCACNGSASITVNSCGASPYNFTWSNGVQHTGITNPSDSITAICTGAYWVEVTDMACSRDTIHFSVPSSTSSSGSVTTANVSCNGGLDGSATANVTGGTLPYTYVWSSGGSGATESNLPAGTYSVTVTDATGCIMIQTSFNISEPTAINLSMSHTDVNCAGDSTGSVSVAASGGTSGYTFLWSSGGTTQSETNLTAGAYTVTVTDANGCVATASDSISEPASPITLMLSATAVTCGNNGTATVIAAGGSGTFIYTWAPTLQSAATATGLAAGTHTVFVSDGFNCTVADSIVVPSNNPLLVSTVSTSATCFGSNDGSATVTASGGAAPYIYSWSTGGTGTTENNLAAGSYTVSVTDTNGCTIQSAVTVSGPAAVTVSIIPGAPSICSGQSATLTASATGGTGAYTYSWSNGGTTASITDSPLAATSYSVTVTDNRGCTGTAIFNLVVDPSPIVSITASDTLICAGECISFSNTGTANAAHTWVFSNGSGSADADPVICFNAPGTYDVSLTLTTPAGCTGTQVIAGFITADPKPVAAFTATPPVTDLSSPGVSFTDQSTGANAWQWSFGDVTSTISTQQHPSHTYTQPGEHQVILIVTNSFSCSDTAFLIILIEEGFSFYAPNAFTPTQDGLNETWLPKGIGIDEKDYDLYIYNRWGELVWQTSVWGTGWDGKVKGQLAPDGIYVWKAEVKLSDGSWRHYTGHITLVK